MFFALGLGVAIGAVYLIALPIYEANTIDPLVTNPEVVTSPVDPDATPLRNLAEVIDYSRISWGIALLLGYAAISITSTARASNASSIGDALSRRSGHEADRHAARGPAVVAHLADGPEERKRRNLAALALLEEWANDEEGEQDQRETVAVLRAALGPDRVASHRPAFR